MVITKERQLLSFILEGLRKRKFIIIVNNSNKVISLFLKFLTINKLIYGFTFYALHCLFIYLKYPLNSQKSLISLIHSEVPRRYIYKHIDLKKKIFT